MTAELADPLDFGGDCFAERVSSRGAERILSDAGMRRDKRRKVIDKRAAVQILQGYLDSGRRGVSGVAEPEE